MEKAKIGIIGLGGVAQLVHLPIIKKIPEAEVIAVADSNRSTLNSVAEKFGISNRYSDFRKLLDIKELEAVIIATPTNTHKDIALACIDAGKDILIEKPIARTFKEADEITTAAKNAKVKVMVGMNMRYRPDIMLLRSIVNSGDLGNIFHIRAGWLKRRSSESRWFLKKEESGGGVILDLGVALLDVALWLMSYPDIISVSAQNYAFSTNSVEDTSIAFIRCHPNSVINLEASWSWSGEKDDFFLELYGTKGNAELNPLKVFKRAENSFLDLGTPKNDNSVNLFKRSYLNELKHFIGAIKGMNPLISPASESLSRMKIVESIYQSAQLQKEIHFKQ